MSFPFVLSSLSSCGKLHSMCGSFHLGGLMILLSYLCMFLSRLHLAFGICRPVLDPIASLFDRLFCGSADNSIEGKGQTLGGNPLPGSDPIEASRRRY